MKPDSSRIGVNTGAPSSLPLADALERLHGWAREIENDATPSQVGPSADELRAVSRALAIALNGLDAIGAGRWNNGAPERCAARDFARRARQAAIDAADAPSGVASPPPSPPQG